MTDDSKYLGRSRGIIDSKETQDKVVQRIVDFIKDTLNSNSDAGEDSLARQQVLLELSSDFDETWRFGDLRTYRKYFKEAIQIVLKDTSIDERLRKIVKDFDEKGESTNPYYICAILPFTTLHKDTTKSIKKTESSKAGDYVAYIAAQRAKFGRSLWKYGRQGGGASPPSRYRGHPQLRIEGVQQLPSSRDDNRGPEG